MMVNYDGNYYYDQLPELDQNEDLEQPQLPMGPHGHVIGATLNSTDIRRADPHDGHQNQDYMYGQMTPAQNVYPQAHYQ